MPNIIQRRRAATGGYTPYTPNASFSANFLMTFPKTNQVIQRTIGANTATINIKGYYSGASIPGGIEAKYGAGSWTTIAASLSPGAFNLTLTGQPVGVGTLQVRPIAAPTDIASVNTVAIGIVVLGVGQSNMTEVATNYHTVTPTGSNIDVCFNASSYSPSDQLSRWYDTSNHTKSFYAEFQQAINDSMNMPVGFLCAAVGGTSSQKWLPSNPLGYVYPTQSAPNDAAYGQGVGLYQRAINMVTDSGAGGVEAIIWHQGEQDITDGVSQGTYQSNLSTIGNQFYTDLGVKFMPCKLQQIYQNDLTTPWNMSAVNTSVANLWAGGGAFVQGPDFSAILSDVDSSGRVHIKNATSVTAQAAGWYTSVKAYRSYP